MALGAVLAAALTDHSSRAIGIFIDGLDVMSEPASPPRYAVPSSSILIEELGPDGVSSMEFTIECTTAMPISVTEGQEVRFDYIGLATLYRYFRGWVDHVDYENMDGDVGTRFKVRCTGIEAALDWLVMPADVTIPVSTDPGIAVQSLAAQATGTVGGLLNTAGSGTDTSTQATPVQTGTAAANFTQNAITVTAGTTLREAIREVTAQAGTGGGYYATVDFWGGLRYYNAIVDGVSISVDNDPPFGGTIVGEDTTYGIDAAQVRTVVVKGTGVTVTVSDGTGKAGATAVLVDSTLTTTAAATVAGQGYLRQYASAARGSVGQSDFAGASNLIHAFQMTALTITDARLGLSGAPFRVTAIARSNFHGAGANVIREDDLFSFGGNPPSVTALTRQLTRTTLS